MNREQAMNRSAKMIVLDAAAKHANRLEAYARDAAEEGDNYTADALMRTAKEVQEAVREESK
jgi:hypothetical protein